MMVTIAEKIVQLREEREELSLQMGVLHKRRSLVNAELLALERSIAPRKLPPVAKPDDVVLSPEPAEVSLTASPK